MAANVETMFYTREKPWHGLGTRVEETPNSKEALILAGLNWKVYQSPIWTEKETMIPGYNKGGLTVALSAQCRVSDFYKKQGYQVQGDSYLDEECPHVWMYKDLNRY